MHIVKWEGFILLQQYDEPIAERPFTVVAVDDEKVDYMIGAVFYISKENLHELKPVIGTVSLNGTLTAEEGK